MTQEQAEAAVDTTTPPTATDPLPPQPELATPDAPTIDTSWMNDASTSEQMLKGPTTVTVTIAKFSPAVKADTGEMYGMSLDLVLDEPVDDNLGGQIPAGKAFNYMKIFTVAKDPSDVSAVKRINGRILKLIAALNGIELPKGDTGDQKLKAALAAAAASNPLLLTPGPKDREQAHYDQHVGKKLRVTLKPNGLDRNGFPQVDLVGYAAVPGAAQSPY